jgi:ABC-2 type transport system permease protein
MKKLREVTLFYKRNLKQTLRNPIWSLVTIFQPLLYLLLFMPLLKNLGGAPGLPLGETEKIFVPGLLVMLAFFGSAFVGFGLIDEIRSGVLERFLVSPASRGAILWGRVFRDTTILLFQCVLITIISIPMGLIANFLGFFLSLFLYALIAISMSSMSYAFALIYKSEDELAPTLNVIVLPISLLSGIFLPLVLAPRWIQMIAKLNPFSYAVNASRELFIGNFFSLDVFYGFFAMSILSFWIFVWAYTALKRMAE